MDQRKNNLTTEAIEILPIRERASFFSRADNDLFQYLITKYKKVLFDTNTDNYTKRQKQRIWFAIVEEFNATAEEPRTLKKLKFKFHNTKTKARKNAADDRPGRKIPSSKDIKWMQSIMAVPADSAVAGDFCIDNHVEVLERAQIEIVQYNPVDTNDNVQAPVVDNVVDKKHIEMEVQVDVKENVIPQRDSLGTPKKIARKNPKPKKTEWTTPPPTITDNYESPDTNTPKKTTNYDKKLYKLCARHMQEQRDEEHELFQLKKRKLMMEITLLLK